MTMQSIPGVVFPGSMVIGVSGNPGSMVIDASGEKAALCTNIYKAGNITKIHFATVTVATGATVDVRVEQMHATNGFPSGSLWATNTNGACVIDSADDTVWKSATLTAPAAVSVGDTLAVVIVRGASGNIQIRTTGSSQAVSSNCNPFGALYTTSWAQSATLPSYFAEYDDGMILPLIFGGIQGLRNFKTFDSGTSPDEVGNIFTAQFKARVCGAQLAVQRIAVGGVLTVQIYDATDSVLASIAIPVSMNVTATQGVATVFFNPVDINEGDQYRITATATTLNDMSLYSSTKPDGAMLHGVGAMYMTERTDAGAWTDTTTEYVHLVPIFSGFDDGAGGGSGGGMRIVGGGLCG